MCCLSIAYHHISYHGCSSIFYVRKLILQKKISYAKNKKSSNNKEEETGIDRFQSISSDFPLPTPFPPRLRWLVLNNNNNKMPLQAKTSSRRRKVYLYDLPSSLPSALVTWMRHGWNPAEDPLDSYPSITDATSVKQWKNDDWKEQGGTHGYLSRRRVGRVGKLGERRELVTWGPTEKWRVEKKNFHVHWEEAVMQGRTQMTSNAG